MYLFALGVGCLYPFGVQSWERKYLNTRRLSWSLSQHHVHRCHLINNGGVWASFWGSVAFTGAGAERWCWGLSIPFCTLLPTHIHGWTALLTGLIFFLPQLALLSCLRLEPAAAESYICSAWGLNLLLFPSSFICSFLVPLVCLIWHY